MIYYIIMNSFLKNTIFWLTYVKGVLMAHNDWSVRSERDSKT